MIPKSNPSPLPVQQRLPKGAAEAHRGRTRTKTKTKMTKSHRSARSSDVNRPEHRTRRTRITRGKSMVSGMRGKRGGMSRRKRGWRNRMSMMRRWVRLAACCGLIERYLICFCIDLCSTEESSGCENRGNWQGREAKEISKEGRRE